MTLPAIFWSILAVVVLLVVPIAMILTMVDYLRGRRSERRGTGGISAGIGAAPLVHRRTLAR